MGGRDASGTPCAGSHTSIRSACPPLCSTRCSTCRSAHLGAPCTYRTGGRTSVRSSCLAWRLPQVAESGRSHTRKTRGVWIRYTTFFAIAENSLSVNALMVVVLAFPFAAMDSATADATSSLDTRRFTLGTRGHGVRGPHSGRLRHAIPGIPRSVQETKEFLAPMIADQSRAPRRRFCWVIRDNC